MSRKTNLCPDHLVEAQNDRIVEVVGGFWRSLLVQDKASLDQAAKGIFPSRIFMISKA